MAEKLLMAFFLLNNLSSSFIVCNWRSLYKDKVLINQEVSMIILAWNFSRICIIILRVFTYVTTG